MKNHTNMIVCLRCGHLKHKNEFSQWFSLRKITKRWCNCCQEQVDSPEVFQEKVEAIQESNKRGFGQFKNHANSEYSKQKRANKKRLAEIEEKRFSDEWDSV